MTVNIKKGHKQLVDEAEALIETLSAEEAIELHGAEGVVIVDLIL